MFIEKLRIVDSDQKLALTNKLFTAIFGFLVLYIITIKFSISEQSFYFNAISFGALQGLVELGISTYLIQHLSGTVNLEDLNKKNRYERNVINAIAGVLARLTIGAIILYVLVFIFFYCTKNNLTILSIYMLMVCISMPLAIIVPIIEGSGSISFAYKIRITIVIFGFIIFLLLASSDNQILSIYSVPLSTILVSLYLWIKNKELLKKIFRLKFSEILSGFKLNSKFQNRLAISWIAGYVQFSIFVPILYYFSFVDEAGKFGLTFQILNSINALIISLITVRSHLYSKKIKESNLTDVMEDFKKTLKFSRLLLIMTHAVFFTITYYLYVENIGLSNKILSIYLVPFLLAVSYAFFEINSYAVIMRSSGSEYLTEVSVIASILLIFFGIPLSYYYGAVGAVTSYFISVFLIQLILVKIKFKDFLKDYCYQ